ATANASCFCLELLLFPRGDEPVATQALLSPMEAGRQLPGGRPLRISKKGFIRCWSSFFRTPCEGADRQLWFASKRSLSYSDGRQTMYFLT
ncbi:unnamed protein product, partial [Musa textilis]